MFESIQNEAQIQAYISLLLTSVSQLVSEFYENTMDFQETLNYVYVLNTINSEAAKIIKNNSKDIKCCLNMNEVLRPLENQFKEYNKLRHIIRSIILQNDLYISRNKKAPEIAS